MAVARIISLHPKLAAVLDGLTSVLLLWWFSHIVSVWWLVIWFVIRVGWWGVLVYSMYFPPIIHRGEHIQALAIFALGIIGLLLFIDENVIWNLIALVAVLAPAVSLWLVPPQTGDLSMIAKPYRRWKFLMSIFGVAGIWSGIKALEVFQVVSGWWLLPLFAIGIGLTVLISLWGWREYGLTPNRSFWLSLLVLAVCVTELSYVIGLWPLGYFASSFFITWVWYVLWLLLRFFISPEGVDWTRQRWFLLANAIGIIIFLVFLVRWQ